MNFILTLHLALASNMTLIFSGGIGGDTPNWCLSMSDTRGLIDIKPSACFLQETDRTQKIQLQPEEENMNTKYPQVLVRLKQSQYEELMNSTQSTGISAPSLLKNAYFEKKTLNFLLPHDIALGHLKEMRRMGELLNHLFELAEKDGLSEHLDLLREISDDHKNFRRLIRMQSGNN